MLRKGTDGVLLRNFARLYGDSPPAVSSGALMTFWEADIAAAPLFPDGIKLIVADAVELFGTPLGEQLQATCINWGWSVLYLFLKNPSIPRTLC